MTALERAKRLSESAVGSRALKLAPLAMAMVMSAHAGVLNVESVACLDSTFSGGNVAGTLSSSPLPMQPNGVQGFKGTGKCGVFDAPYSGIGATAFWYGSGSDFAGGSSVNAPIDYEFSFGGNGGFSTVDWVLEFKANGSVVGSKWGSSSMYTPISGTFSALLPGDLSTFTMSLQFFGFYDGDSVAGSSFGAALPDDAIDFGSAALYVDIPENSIDVNRAADDPAQVPEPGMFVLAGTGLLGVMLLRRRS